MGISSVHQGNLGRGKKMYSFHTQVLADFPSWARFGFQVSCNCFRVIGLEASSFVFSMVSLCFLMMALATCQIQKRSKGLYSNMREENLQWALASLWVCKALDVM